MADIVSPEVRSRMMSGIRGRNTKPELLLRRGLHSRGFRFRLHRKNMAGRPDLIFPQWNAVIFAHGCFWHGHNCTLFKWPKSNDDFWRKKIEGNRIRDAEAIQTLEAAGWRCAIVWECALKGSTRFPIDTVLSRCEKWLKSQSNHLELQGKIKTKIQLVCNKSTPKDK